MPMSSRILLSTQRRFSWKTYVPRISVVSNKLAISFHGSYLEGGCSDAI